MDDPSSNHNGYYIPAARVGSSSEASLATPPKPALRQAKSSTLTSSTSKSTKISGHGNASRFQCPKCPKNFSRIENLTRHSANHEDLGKFTCAVCKKRFTRSDLLNRHRRIHAASQSEVVPKSHVTQLQFGSVPLPSNSTIEGATSRDNSRSVTPQEELLSDPLPPRLSSQHSLSNLQQEGYVSSLHHAMAPTYQVVPQPTIPPANPLLMSQSHGLTNLMEAALAPPEQFSQVRNANLNMWDDGFVSDGNLMGAYDGDMSWVMETFNNEALSNSNYSSDYDMLNNFGDMPQPQHQFLQYPPPQQLPPPPSQIKANPTTNEEEDTNWPDMIDNQPRRAPRVVPLGLSMMQRSWQPLLDEARGRPFPPNVPKLQHVSTALRQSLIDALNGDQLRNEFSIAEIGDAMFPPPEALDFFLRLYLQFIQPRFPVLHLPTFDVYACPPFLLVAMLLLGSSHSFSDNGRFTGTFHHNLRVACLRMQELDTKFLRSLDNILTYFLLCLAGTWSMSKESYEFAEGSRGVLITACRRMRLLDCRPSSFDTSKFRNSPFGVEETKWLAWIDNEKSKRLGLSVYMYDCQYPALFNIQHFVSKAETTNCVFPCDEALWEAHSAESWRALLGPAILPKPEYWMGALNCCLLHRYIKPAPAVVKTAEFGKILLLYAIHTHIYDWRQATCMLAPTGLMDINAIWDLGNPLREKRIWLLDALDSWAECYQDENTSTAARLLHRLGYISIDLNLSDMHLVAGRTANQDDGTFAEHNLKRWANSETASSTMSHIFSMLQICHQQVQNNTAADCSYEICVCLFTGGIVCWAYSRLKEGGPREDCMEEVLKASNALRHMGAGGCWRACALFGRILKSFRSKTRV